MAIRFIGINTTGIDADANGDLWILLENQYLTNAADAFDFVTFSNCEILVEGSVISQTDAIDSDAGSAANTVTVSTTGLVYGSSDGIEMSGDQHEVYNYGEVSGLNDRGIQMIGDFGRVVNSGICYGQSDGISLEGASNFLTNTGEIHSEFDGVNVSGNGNKVVSTGSIFGERHGIEFNTIAAEENTFVNKGLIASTGLSGDGVRGDFGNETVVNHGIILGNVQLLDGDDTFRGSGEVSGFVDGGAGTDILRGGGFDDEFYGGTQDDALFGRDGDDVMDGGNGSDLLRGGAGDDTLQGGRGADVIRGGSGEDTIDGGEGFDTIIGGTGDDTLSGGSLADVFVLAPNSGSDIILDFEDGVDQIDLSAFGFRQDQFNAVIMPAVTSSGGGEVRIDLAELGGDGVVIVQGLGWSFTDLSDFIL